MSSSSRQLLHLGRHFSLLTEHLKSLWDEIDLKEEERANEIRIIFKDGIRHIHRVVLATLSPSLKKVLLALDSSPGQIQVPDSSVVEGEHLLRLIYTGGTTLRDEATVEKLHDLSDSFKFKSLSVVKDYINLEEEEEEGGKKEGTLPHEEEELPMLTISEVPTKKVAKTVKRKRVTATEATKVDPSPEEGGSVRRSKRPKVKSKRFRDYEVQPGKEFIKEEEELASKDTRGVPEISSPRESQNICLPSSNTHSLSSSCGNKGPPSSYVSVMNTSTDKPHSSSSSSSFMKPSAKDDNSPIISLHVNDNDVNLPINHKISSVHEVQSENYSESGDAIVRPCLLCKKRLFGQNNYISHMKAEHGSAQGPYPCAKCDQTFLTGQKIVEHFKISHDGAVKTSKGLEHFPCRDCNLSFLNKATFRQHCRVKHGAYKKKKEGFRCQEEECPEAGVIFNSFIAFRTHMTQSHNIAPLKCETCGKRFMDVQALKHHTEMHFGTDEYPCDVCFKKFRTRGRLFAHRSLHLGRRYSCQDCDFKTRSRGGLTIHRQLKHEEKRFACKFCGKKFGTKQNMEAHTRIHTGESPYECEVCAMKFKRLHHLRSHLVTVSHTQKVNDLESKGIPIPQELEQEQKRIQKGRAQIKDISAVKDQSDGAPTKGLLECAVCTLSFHSKNKLRSHLKSNQHLKKTMRPDDEETQVISSSYDSAKGQAMVRVQIKPETASYNQYSEQLHISSSHHLDYARPGESSVTVLNLDDKVLLDEEDILMMDFGGGSDQINVAAAESNLLLQCHNPAQVGGGGSLENVQLVIVDHPVSNPNVIASHTSDRAVHYSSEDLVRLSENSAASSAPPLILAEDDKIIPLPFETT